LFGINAKYLVNKGLPPNSPHLLLASYYQGGPSVANGLILRDTTEYVEKALKYLLKGKIQNGR